MASTRIKDARIPTRAIAAGAITADKLDDELRQGRYLFQKFMAQPLCFHRATGVTALQSANATNINAAIFPDGKMWDVYETTAQTLMPLLHATKGLEIALDQVDNESVEYVPGVNNPVSALARTAGTDDDFFIRAVLEITDASGLDQMLVGWRKQEAFAVPTQLYAGGDAVYTDLCGIGFGATAADPNPVHVVNTLNGDASAISEAVNFTWADTLKHELTMKVIGRVAFFEINGIPLGDAVAIDADGSAITSQNTVINATKFTFDDGDVLVPFLFLRQDANVSPVYITELEIGSLLNIADSPAHRGNQ